MNAEIRYAGEQSRWGSGALSTDPGAVFCRLYDVAGLLYCIYLRNDDARSRVEGEPNAFMLMARNPMRILELSPQS